MVINPSCPYFNEISTAIPSIYEDNLWFEDAIFLERNSRSFMQRIRKINSNAEKITKALVNHPKGILKYILSYMC